MTTPAPDELGIGEVSARTGLTERTLRYYEELGLGAGPVHRAPDGRAHLGVVHAGDGEVWLHEEHAQSGMVSPLSAGGVVTGSLAVHVDDAHHAHAVRGGACVAYPPTDQPYGCREYGVRDPEGHLWSFQHPLQESPDE